LTGKEKTSGQLKKGEIVLATVESLAPGGDGVTRERGMPIFISRVAVGDRVELQVFDVRKDFARGRLLRVLDASPERVEPPCKLFKVCGGCQWQHIEYRSQLKAKERILQQTLKHLAGLDPQLVKPAIGAEGPLFYRNKVQFPVQHPRGSERLLAGYYKQDSHELVNIKHCPVQPEPLDRLLEAVKTFCEKHSIEAYDETTRTGLLRHIAARYSFDRRAILVTLVVNSAPEQVPSQRVKQRPASPVDLLKMTEIAQALMEKVPEIAGVCLNYNPHEGNRIMGDITISLAGQPYVIEKIATDRSDLPVRLRQGMEFKLSPTSFFQVNTAQTVKLMEQILDAVMAQPARFKTELPLVVDAYAGVGAIALWLAPIARQVIAVEEHPAAVDDGLLNLELNRIENVDFRLGMVESVFPQLLSEGLVPDVLVVDPPRKGLSQESLESIVKLAVERIVYVSCNPATLARDLKFFGRNGYKTKQIQPVDMFPQTYHIESVTLLERQT
jgi:23S rRNA (uracil1939-C5)-methyltransferase